MPDAFLEQAVGAFRAIVAEACPGVVLKPLPLGKYGFRCKTTRGALSVQIDDDKVYVWPVRLGYRYGLQIELSLADPACCGEFRRTVVWNIGPGAVGKDYERFRANHP